MSAMNVLEGIVMNEDRYVELLTRLISESKLLQNSPAQGMALFLVANYNFRISMPNFSKNAY